LELKQGKMRVKRGTRVERTASSTGFLDGKKVREDD
jgi:hypothetical protein